MPEIIRNFLHHLLDVRGLIEWGGVAMVCMIVFAETGLFVGFFLPGDSLLVTAGVFAAAGQLKLSWLTGSGHIVRHCRRSARLSDRL